MASEDTRKTLKNVEQLADRALSGSTPRTVDQKSEEIREQYNYYYNRIYPLLKEGKIDFHKVAEKTGYKERRIRETMLFRLTTGEVMQLFGKKDGYCYICSCRLFSVNTKEPMCLSCLQTLDTAIQELHIAGLDAPAVNRPPRAEKCEGEQAEDTAPVFQIPGFDATETVAEETVPDWVPREQYEALAQEVKAYRTMYGPLPMQTAAPVAVEELSLQVKPAGSGLDAPQAAVSSDATADAPAKPDAVLDILSLPDQPLDQAAMQDISRIVGDAPIRHFGFQRMKARS